jgi:hypothetical protein
MIRFSSIVGIASLPVALSEGQAYQITVKGQSSSNGLYCLDLYGGQKRAGSPIDIWTCDVNNPKGQLWYFDEGTFKIRSALDPSICIDAGDTKQGSALIINACSISISQLWGYDSKAARIYLQATVSQASQAMCMDVKNAVYKDGTSVQAWPCDGLPNQQWSISIPKPPPRPFMMMLDDGGNNPAKKKFCIDLYGGDTKKGNKVDVWECSPGAKGQQWLFADGAFKIQSVLDPKKCIDAGSPPSLRNHLILWDCIDNAPQQTFGYDFKSGGIFIGKKLTGNDLCISVTGYNNGNGLQLYTCNSQPTEKWKISDAQKTLFDAPLNGTVAV